MRLNELVHEVGFPLNWISIVKSACQNIAFFLISDSRFQKIKVGRERFVFNRLGSKNGVVVIALASHLRAPGST